MRWESSLFSNALSRWISANVGDNNLHLRARARARAPARAQAGAPTRALCINVELKRSFVSFSFFLLPFTYLPTYLPTLALSPPP